MIKCNRCGKMTAAGAGYCQSCGVPLSTAEAGLPPQMASQEQPELPAWLESLRAGERSAPPPSAAPTSFSAADFIDQSSLPNWMRPERNEARDNTASNPQLPPRPSGASGFAADEPASPGNGFHASSLIDEQALPSWMQGLQSSQGPQAAPPPLPAAPPPSEGFSAASLVQPESLPSWMKNLQPPQAAPGPVQSPMERSEPAKSPSPAAPPAHGFSAHDLIDEKALPSWMATGQSDSRSAQTPTYLNQPANHPAPVSNVPAQSGFSASSLLDVDSLPQWLREGGQSPNAAPTSGWGAPPPANQQGANMSASSFIDMNALPSWLRTADQGGQPGMGGPAEPAGRPGGYSVPPRPDNMRVPSRPRNELNPNESSEVAANVFASMLGVASSTPNYPNQPVNSPYGQPNQGPMGMPGNGQIPATPPAAPPPSPAQAPQNSGYAGGNMYGGYGSAPGANYTSNPNGYGSGNTGGYSLQQGPGMNAGYPGNQMGGNSPRPLSTPTADNKMPGKTGKRNFLDTLLGWFERK